MISQPIVDAARDTAAATGLPAEYILTVVDVESGGRDVESYDGRTPHLLPEPRVFYKLLPEAKRAAAVASGLAMASGRPDYTAIAGTSAARCARLAAMVAVDEEAGYGACSYGLPQIMGEHAADLGYPSAKALFERFRDGGVHEQVAALVKLVDHMGIRADLMAGRWERVAAVYNGPAWKENDYANKLAAAHARWHAQLGAGAVPEPDAGMLALGDKGPAVESLQRTLTRIGYVVRVDGDFGPSTETQVLGFQHQHGIQADGRVGPETLRALTGAKPRPLGARALATARSVGRSTRIGFKARMGKLAAVGVGAVQAFHAAGVGPSDVVAHVQSVVDTVTSARTTYQGLVDLLPSADSVPHGLASVALATASSPTAVATVGGCVGLWTLCHGILRDRTSDEVSGRTA